MKKLLFILVIGSVFASALFFGCSFFEPPNVDKNAPSQSPGSIDPERKDALALKHLQIPNVSEDTLASYVMDFLDAGTSAGRSALPARTVAITKTTKITHEVETGFAETTADKRSARTIIGPGQIPFYVFTLEDSHTGKTGFALTCGDSRIGNVLAVVEEGNYDDDHPFLGIFYTGLNAYIEDTISIYNSITEADIESALNKTSEARAVASNVPVTDVGKLGGFFPTYIKKDKLLPVTWRQSCREENTNKYIKYNNIIMDVKRPPDGYYYVAGCGPVAIAQIMAFHSKKMIDAGKPAPYLKSQAPGYTDVKYDWPAMIAEIDEKAIRAIGVLMYEIGLPENADSTYTMGLIKKDDEKEDDNSNKKDKASTGTSCNNVRFAFRNMGYRDPGYFAAYKFSVVKYYIENEEPVMATGYTAETIILGIKIPAGTGHLWVIDGCAQMTTKVKDKVTGKEVDIEDYPLDYVHCNMGWGGLDNGWYISGVFDTRHTKDGDGEDAHNYPHADEDGDLPLNVERSVKDGGYYRYNIQMLTGIRPK